MKKFVIMACMMACASTLYSQDKPDPLKVYILAGQSNMTGIVSKHTLEHIKMFPDTAKEFADLFDEDGNPVTLDDVYVSQWKGKDGGKLAPRFGGGKGTRFGPDYAFGVYMHKKLKEPFLIIKTSQGGKDINYHFRPPSAGTWVPPAGHPDLIKEEPVKLALPDKIDLPADYLPGEDLVPRRPGRIGKFMGMRPMRGVAIGEVNGVYPIYITASPEKQFPGNPFQKGDLLLGVDGTGFREEPVYHWRDAFWGSRTVDGDWMVTVTRWRKGKIETFDFDIAQTLEGGRKSLPEHRVELKKAAVEKDKQTGGYYRDMIKHVKMVLSDAGKYHPAYDPEAGYEIAGFVWFQGYNDLVNSSVYPNRDKPGGYEQYTWLLEHFIRDVRKDFNVPDMPFVVGVLGVGGIDDPPTSNLGYFQQAQAAVAEKPEFRETVANVHAGKYWDHDLAALDQKSREVRNKMSELKYKDGLEGDELKKAYAEYRARHITPQEEEILKKAISNQGYHYYGSGKIMAGIGKGFAEAMIALEKKKDQVPGNN